MHKNIMESFLVSVVIPVYNADRYLRECLNSVIEQTYTKLEVILIDDGSTDESGAICDEYAAVDKRFRVIHMKNNGPGRARNEGIKRAHGKYIIFMDSDDYWLPQTIETLYNEAERNNIQILAFSANPLLEEMDKPEFYLSYQHTVQNGIVKSGVESLKTALDAREYYSNTNLRFILRKYIEETGIRFDEGIIHEDEKFSLLTYLFAERVECIGERLYQRRYHSGSLMTNKAILKSGYGCRKILDDLMDVYDNLQISDDRKEQLGRYIGNIYESLYNLFKQAYSRDRKQARQIQNDTRQTLKRVRAVPGLSRELRIGTYSLFLGYRVVKVYGTIRKIFRNNN